MSGYEGGTILIFLTYTPRPPNKQMKKDKQFYIAEWYKTDEEKAKRVKRIKKEMQSVLRTIKAGKIYADIKSVSRSGMSRRIAFYRVKNGRIERITSEIAWLGGYLTPGKHDGDITDNGLRVSGCGMDMIFNTLYNCMPYSQARKWNQVYKRL